MIRLNPTHSDRQRRYRARLRAGLVVAPVSVSLPVIEALIVFKWLPEKASEDRQQVAKAIAAVLEEMASNWAKEKRVTRRQY